jgi:mono/diheme cytochrome c family protein
VSAVKAGWMTLVVVVAAANIRANDEATDRLFTGKIKPLLETRCISCHGPDKVKGGLRLDSRAAALKGGESGPALVPGKPTESLIVQAVMHARPDLEMPPKDKLTKGDIALLERWIEGGAPWPETKAGAASAQLPAGERIGDAWSDPRNPIVGLFGGQRLDLWSLKPIRGPAVPAPQDKRWVRNPIDSFILARLEGAGLKPSPRAGRRALARRLYFDLTGLPPTPYEMEEFLADKAPDAYERLVDRLLKSPRYGEQWARLWLDAIRYSDSNGFDWDEFRPRAWRFRDYVIRSFNGDKRFDQFIREQLAGDELLEGPPRDPVEQDYLIATGYLRLGPHDNSAPSFNEQDRSRAELMADLVETTGSAFLGLTMSCCRCHDHKYDPLAQADHFRLRAFFEPVRFADDLPLDTAAEQAAIRGHNEQVDRAIKPWEEHLEALVGSVKNRLRSERIAKLAAEEQELLKLSKDQCTTEQKEKIEALEKKVAVREKEILAALTADEKSKHDGLAKQIGKIKREKRDFTLGLLMTDNAEKVPLTKILYQGDHKQEREPVMPGVISAVDPNPAAILKPVNPKTTGRRLTLANWIVSKDNPLTARVIVNRVWQNHFGRGLVLTANDFGLAGARPTHPELLDWLASEFSRQGWSLKELHRLIVTSAAYGQVSSAPEPLAKRAAQVDADNNLLWRQNLRRLTAEQLRDSLLAVSGTLRERRGGPAVWPELPAEVLQANPAFLDDNGEKTKGWYPSPAGERDVRSIYLVQKRTVRVPFMETFDLPENTVSCARRNESIVPPQALSLLNGPLSLQAARNLAARVERQAPDDSSRQVEAAFAFVLQRQPGSDEHRACRALLRGRNLTELCRALLNVNEFIYVD